MAMLNTCNSPFFHLNKQTVNGEYVRIVKENPFIVRGFHGILPSLTVGDSFEDNAVRNADVLLGLN